MIEVIKIRLFYDGSTVQMARRTLNNFENFDWMEDDQFDMIDNNTVYIVNYLRFGD